MNHIMLDIETLDTRPSAVVLSVAASVFESEGGGQIDTLYSILDASEQQAMGRTIDAGTVLWWLRQSDGARAEVVRPDRVSVHEFVADLTRFFGVYTPECVWGNGSDFDNVIVASLCESVGRPAPWKFYQNRCFRTLRNHHRDYPEPEFHGLEHNALDDAVHQALWCQGILGRLTHV